MTGYWKVHAYGGVIYQCTEGAGCPGCGPDSTAKTVWVEEIEEGGHTIGEHLDSLDRKFTELAPRVDALERHLEDHRLLKLHALLVATSLRVTALEDRRPPGATAPASDDELWLLDRHRKGPGLSERWHLVPEYPSTNTKSGWEPCWPHSGCESWPHEWRPVKAEKP